LAHQLKQPSMVLIGSNDVVAPRAAIVAMLDTLSRRPEIVEIASAGHGDIFDVASADERAKVVRFLNSSLGDQKG
jgi:pimeloyl-ACP methyl ester carboxylesterase